mgnify:CR=1 FL=1
MFRPGATTHLTHCVIFPPFRQNQIYGVFAQCQTQSLYSNLIHQPEANRRQLVGTYQLSPQVSELNLSRSIASARLWWLDRRARIVGTTRVRNATGLIQLRHKYMAVSVTARCSSTVILLMVS